MAMALGAEVKKPYRFHLPGPNKIANTNEDYIIINNTCSELARVRLYPDDLLVKLCHAIAVTYHCPIVLTGTEADHDYYERILSHELLRGLKIENRSGKQSIEQFLMSMNDNCRLLVTVDSAPLHYAWRLGIPTVSLWGPTNPSTRMQESPHFKSVYLAVPCSPCTHHTTVLPCGGDNFCMKNMSVEMILKKVEEVLR